MEQELINKSVKVDQDQQISKSGSRSTTHHCHSTFHAWPSQTTCSKSSQSHKDLHPANKEASKTSIRSTRCNHARKKTADGWPCRLCQESSTRDPIPTQFITHPKLHPIESYLEVKLYHHTMQTGIRRLQRDWYWLQPQLNTRQRNQWYEKVSWNFYMLVLSQNNISYRCHKDVQHCQYQWCYQRNLWNDTLDVDQPPRKRWYRHWSTSQIQQKSGWARLTRNSKTLQWRISRS